jgi:Mn2+/Fe2+ NRAMP family transporter
VNQVQLAFNVALIVSAAIFVGLLGALLWAIRPYKNFERGVATLVWAFPASVLATMILGTWTRPTSSSPFSAAPGSPP